MKKFLAVLALVFCMALPASAATEPETWYVSNDSSIKAAVANANSGDTIVVEKSIDLMDDALTIRSNKSLTLHINEGCTLSASNLDWENTICISVEDGNLTITGSGTISATNTSGTATHDAETATAIDAYNSTVSIMDSLKITANGKEESNGIVAGGSAKVGIFGGTVTGKLVAQENAIMTVYNATVNGKVLCEASQSSYKPTMRICDVDVNGNIVVSGDTARQIIYAVTLSGDWGTDYGDGRRLGPDSSLVDAESDTVANNAKMTFDPGTIEVTQGETKTQAVTVTLCASDAANNPLTINELEVVSPSVDGITVTPSSSDGTVTFEVTSGCAAGTYNFSVLCSAPNQNPNLDLTTYYPVHMQVKNFTVNVKKGSSGSSSSGCNAGFGALALAALAVIAAKQRKK